MSVNPYAAIVLQSINFFKKIKNLQLSMVALGKAEAGGSLEFELSMICTADPTSIDKQPRGVLHSPGEQACGAISLGHMVPILHADFV